MLRIRQAIGSIALLALISVSVFAQLRAPPHIERLPPVDPGNLRFVQRKLDDRDLVLFAADSIEMRIPMKWQVREVPFGREIRLVIAPTLPRLERQMPNDGMWVSCHVWSKNRPRSDVAGQLKRFLESHSVDSYPAWQARTLKWQRMQLAKFPAVAQHFEGSIGKTSTKGMHIAIRTDWGVCEIVAVAPARVYAQRSAAYRRTFADMKINAVKAPQGKPTRQTVAAQQILGSWKAFRSRLRLLGSGRIIVITDRPIRLTRFDGKQRQPKRLTGRYRAQGDLVYVTWSDGSKLNFRWRLRGEDLLLTDHEGQVSQLRRILE